MTVNNTTMVDIINEHINTVQKKNGVILSSQTRQFRRKQQRQWSYEQYAKSRTVQQKNSRIEQAKTSFTSTYRRVIPNIIPAWQTNIALLFPPKWWNNVVCYLLRVISPAENREKLLQLNMRGKRSFFRMFRFWTANMIYTITILSMIKLRSYINEFGITLKIDTTHKENKEFIRFRIFRFLKCFHEEEMEL